MECHKGIEGCLTVSFFWFLSGRLRHHLGFPSESLRSDDGLHPWSSTASSPLKNSGWKTAQNERWYEMSVLKTVCWFAGKILTYPNFSIHSNEVGKSTTHYKWNYAPFKWPYKWVTMVISPTIEAITLLTAIVSGSIFPTYPLQENQGTGTSQASLLTSYTTEVGWRAWEGRVRMNPPSYNRPLGGWAGPHLVLVPKLPRECRPCDHFSGANCYFFWGGAVS